MELLIFALLFGGGVVLAAALMLCATLASKSFAGRLILVAAALVVLLAQGGCWYLAVGVGKATGGTGDGGGLFTVVVVAAIAVLVWAVFLLSSTEARTDKTSPGAPTKQDPAPGAEDVVEDSDPDAGIK